MVEKMLVRGAEKTLMRGAEKTLMRGADIIIDTLRTIGVERIYGVPGESFLAVLDGLYEQANDDRGVIEFITCRHEGGASYMAEAEGKLNIASQDHRTIPGVACVTRGPGAANAMIGLHTSYQDGTPMILFIGQIDTYHRERDCFQEIDYRRIWGPITKWVAEINHADRIQEMILRAAHVACSGRPGPVVIALPENIQVEEVEFTPVPFQQYRQNFHPPQLSNGFMDRLQALLQNAQQPVLILGGNGWGEEAHKNIQTFAENYHLPVMVTFRSQDAFDNHHQNYMGVLGLGAWPELHRFIKECDLLLVIGSELQDTATNDYQLIDCPNSKQKLIHILDCEEQLGKLYQPTLSAIAHPHEAAKALAGLAEPSLAERALKSPLPWMKNIDLDQMHAAFNDFSRAQIEPDHGHINLSEVVKTIEHELHSEAIVTNGAGNYAIWLHRFYHWLKPSTQLAPRNGSMGYGLPAAIAASLKFPKKQVINFTGDGCFMMTAQECATIAKHNLNILIIVIDNGCYGTIRMHQENHFPNRQSGTGLHNPDFVVYAQSFGIWACKVEDNQGFDHAFARTMAQFGPALIHIKSNPDQLKPSPQVTELNLSKDDML